MAVVSKVKLNGTTYDIRDHSKVMLSGDTMTGELALKSSTADSTTTPSGYIYRGVNFKDKNELTCGRVRGFWSTSGAVGVTLQATRQVSGDAVSNELALAVTPTGDLVIAVSDPVPWRSALNVYNKSETYSKTEAVDKFRVQYFENRAVSVGSSAQILRIPASGTSTSITTDTIVLDCNFTDLSKVTTNSVEWQSYDGYIVFNGTCTSATTADVVLGTKVN